MASLLAINFLTWLAFDILLDKSISIISNVCTELNLNQLVCWVYCYIYSNNEICMNEFCWIISLSLCSSVLHNLGQTNFWACTFWVKSRYQFLSVRFQAHANALNQLYAFILFIRKSGPWPKCKGMNQWKRGSIQKCRNTTTK